MRSANVGGVCLSEKPSCKIRFAKVGCRQDWQPKKSKFFFPRPRAKKGREKLSAWLRRRQSYTTSKQTHTHKRGGGGIGEGSSSRREGDESEGGSLSPPPIKPPLPLPSRLRLLHLDWRGEERRGFCWVMVLGKREEADAARETFQRNLYHTWANWGTESFKTT